MRTTHGHRIVIATMLALALIGCERAETPAAADTGVQSREVDYGAGETTLKGFVAWNGARTEPRPGVLVVHEWWGHNEHARAQARRLAEAGYVAFALDMYGDGKSTTHPDSAQAFMAAATSDVAKLMARFEAGLAQLKADPHVDSTRVAAIGYCFGGMVVLSQARAGADLDAVASFHGAIPPPAPVDSGTVKARVLILTGGADPMVPAAQVDAFAAALRAAGAGVDVVTYPTALHSFTNPRADSVGMAGLKYDGETDRQSWDALLKLLSEVFP
ncbi:MAG: dienelactone hydrolase family protein [Gemmatimonadaceae bacterium]